MKIKSLENFKDNEILLNSEMILGGDVRTEGGSRAWSQCDSGMCYSHDTVHDNGIKTYHNIHDCDTEPYSSF